MNKEQAEDAMADAVAGRFMERLATLPDSISKSDRDGIIRMMLGAAFIEGQVYQMNDASSRVEMATAKIAANISRILSR